MCVTEISGEEGLDGAEEIFEDIKAENFEKLITNYLWISSNPCARNRNKIITKRFI